MRARLRSLVAATYASRLLLIRMHVCAAFCSKPSICRNLFFVRRNFDKFSTILASIVFYDKDRGGPAQLGTRDWAGLKGHGGVWNSRRQRRLVSHLRREHFRCSWAHGPMMRSWVHRASAGCCFRRVRLFYGRTTDRGHCELRPPAPTAKTGICVI